MKKIWKSVIIGSIILIVLTSIIVPLTINFISNRTITINGDDDFNKYNFPGEGTADNPFIIENYSPSTGSFFTLYL